MMTRRTLLALISSVPLAARSALQTPVRRERRAICRGTFTFVLEPDGALNMCVLEGLGYDGRHAGLGHTDPLTFNLAFDLPAVRHAMDLASSGPTSCAVMPDGRILAWGINARGGLGITPLAEFEATGQVRPVPTAPTPVLDITDAVRVASGGDHTLAMTGAGAVYAWGYNILASWASARCRTSTSNTAHRCRMSCRIPCVFPVCPASSPSLPAGRIRSRC